MKTIVIILLLACSAYLHAWDPVFQQPFQITPVNSTDAYNFKMHHPDPCIEDWDNDGLEDLIVGSFNNGRISWWKNTGSIGNPAFEPMGYLKADGKNISVGGS